MKEIIEIIPYFIGCLINVTLCHLSYIKLSDDQELTIKTFIVSFIVSIIILLNNCYNNLWLKVVITALAFCISFKILYKENMKKTIIKYIIIYTMLTILEIVVTNILLNTGIMINNSAIILHTYMKMLLSIIIPGIEYLLFSISIINKIFKKIINFFIININYLNVAYIFIITGTTLGMLNIQNFATKGSLKLIIILYIMFLLLFIIIIKSKSKEEFLKKSNERLVEYNEKYGQFLDEYKVYKHNIKNKLVGMKAFGNKKINSLIDDLLEEETTFSIKNNNLYNVPNGIKGIVAEKLYNINIHAIIDNNLKGDPFIKLQPKEFNSISEAIGICIDNAVEASIETKEPVVLLDLKEDDDYIFIKIGNNFCNDINIEELGDKYYSTKNRNSGLGLFSIMRNKFIKEKISIINNFYYIELKIKKARC